MQAPIRALYLCDNRFVLINAHPYQVRVTWRIQGTDEQGELTLRAAPAADPPFSEVELAVAHSGTLALYRGEELLGVRENERMACAPVTSSAALVAAASSTAGAWSAPFTWPIVAVHLHLLKNGRVSPGVSSANRTCCTPSNGSFAAKPAGAWLFCAGHTFLPDGRLLVAGGHISDAQGLPDTHIFKVNDQSWTNDGADAEGTMVPDDDAAAERSGGGHRRDTTRTSSTWASPRSGPAAPGGR